MWVSTANGSALVGTDRERIGGVMRRPPAPTKPHAELLSVSSIPSGYRKIIDPLIATARDILERGDAARYGLRRQPGHRRDQDRADRRRFRTGKEQCGAPATPPGSAAPGRFRLQHHGQLGLPPDKMPRVH